MLITISVNISNPHTTIEELTVQDLYELKDAVDKVIEKLATRVINNNINKVSNEN